MLTGSNFEITFGFTTISIIANVTLRLINYLRKGHFVDFIFEDK